MNPTIETLTPLQMFFAQYGLLLLSAIVVVFAIIGILLSLLNRREKQQTMDSSDENAFLEKCNSLLDDIVILRAKLKGSGTIKEKDMDEQLRTLEKTVLNRKLNQ